MKKEIIKEKHITISVEGKNESEINAAIDTAFASVAARVKRGEYSFKRRPLNLRKAGNAGYTFGVEAYT